MTEYMSPADIAARRYAEEARQEREKKAKALAALREHVKTHQCDMCSRLVQEIGL